MKLRILRLVRDRQPAKYISRRTSVERFVKSFTRKCGTVPRPKQFAFRRPAVRINFCRLPSVTSRSCQNVQSALRLQRNERIDDLVLYRHTGCRGIRRPC